MADRFAKPCEDCKRRPAEPRERYCWRCRGNLLHRLRCAGYLEPLPQPERYRSAGAREDRNPPLILEEIAVRAWEDSEGVDCAGLGS